MAGLVDAFSLIAKKSLEWKLWVYLFAVALAGILAFFVSLMVVLLAGLVVFFALNLSPVALLIYFILFVLFVLLMFAVGSAMTGTSLNLTREFLEKGKLDFNSAWNKTQPRIFTAVKVELIVFVFFSVIFLIVFFPFISSLINFFNSFSLAQLALLSSPQQLLKLLLPLVGSLLFGILLFLLVSIIVLPFSVIYRQIPFFESESSVDSIKRAIFLAKKNYLKNFAFYLIMFFFLFAVSLVYSLVLVLLSLPLATGILWLIIIFTLFRIILQIVFSVWATAFSYLFEVKIYELNAVSFPKKPSAKKLPVKKPAAKKLSARKKK